MSPAKDQIDTLRLQTCLDVRQVCNFGVAAGYCEAMERNVLACD